MKIGDVIRIFDNNINPPKVKYIIIVGVSSQELATIYINTESRTNPLSSPELQGLQYPLLPKDCTPLRYESVADWATIYQKGVEK